MRGGDRQNCLGHVAGFFSRNTLLKKGTKNCSAGKKTEPKNRTKKTKPTFTVVAGDDTFRVLVSTKDGIHAEKIFSRLVDGFQLLLTGFFLLLYPERNPTFCFEKKKKLCRAARFMGTPSKTGANKKKYRNSSHSPNEFVT